MQAIIYNIYKKEKILKNKNKQIFYKKNFHYIFI